MAFMPKFSGTEEEDARAERLLKEQEARGIQPVITDETPDTPYDAWVKKHQAFASGRGDQGLEGKSFGDISDPGVAKQLLALRGAKSAVKGRSRPSSVTVGRPDMPEDSARNFSSLADVAPIRGDLSGAGQGPTDPQKYAQASAGTGGSGTAGIGKPVDQDMLDAERMANSRRTREGLYAAGRMIGRAGLEKNPQAAQLDAAAMARADEPLKFVTGQKAEARKKAEDSRLAEDQGFQRQANTRAEETQGFNREEQVRKRDYGDERSAISVRRRAEAMALYPKEIGRIPKETFSRMTAGDVDVLLKELNMQKDRASGGAALDRLFAQQVASLSDKTAKMPYGEVENIAQKLEAAAPGITSGSYQGEDPLGGRLERVAGMVPGGVGESFVGGKHLAAQKAVKELGDLVERMRSGAVINDQEAAHYNSLIGGGPLQDPRSLSQGVQTVLGSIRSKLRNAQAGYNYLHNSKGQTPLDVVSGQGGTDFRQHGGGGPQRKTVGGKTYEKHADGWYEVD